MGNEVTEVMSQLLSEEKEYPGRIARYERIGVRGIIAEIDLA